MIVATPAELRIAALERLRLMGRCMASERLTLKMHAANQVRLQALIAALAKEAEGEARG